ncbi:WXG100 family type VII secretion target [Dactylosporangium sp. CA-233914]|uniref:WXG100 family type VII secretion target n=1 Tax=Dactylosporangium sp. CA-233914 TaxID=3239934 RepID=UPI003D921927
MPDIAGSTLQVPPELETAGARMSSTATTISDELIALKAMLAPLEAHWTGTAQPYYEALQAQWNNAARELFGPDGVLGDIASALNLAWRNYSECEWVNTRTWRG